MRYVALVAAWVMLLRPDADAGRLATGDAGGRIACGVIMR